MPRIRTYKPEFFRSPDTAKASHKARLLYLAMWSWADDEGRGETNVYGLLGFAFPDEDQVTAEELQSLLKEVRGSYGVVFYVHRGRFYYAVPAFSKHQKTERKAQGRYPSPDDPESTPDLRFETSDDDGGNSSPPEGGSALGTGEQGNRGTVLVGATEVSHQSADPVAPPEKCSRHINDPDPPSCGGCAQASRNRKTWDRDQARVAADELDAKRQERQAAIDAVANCHLCDSNGIREIEDDQTIRCTHKDLCGSMSAMGSPCERADGHPVGKHRKYSPNGEFFEWDDESQKRLMEQWGTGGT